MSLATPPATGGNTTLLQRLDQVRQEIAAQRRRTARSAMLTAVVGLAALALLGAYFYYGYTSLNEVTQPKKLVDVAQQVADDNLPQARAALEEQIKNAAPGLAVDLSKRMLEAMPNARESLEGYALEQLDTAVDQSASLSDEQFDAFIKDSRPLLQAKYKELAGKPELAKESLEEVEAALDKQVRADMKAHVTELLATLMASNEKLKRLKEGKGLTPDEKIERRVLMLARRLRAEQAGETPATEKTDPTATKPARSAPKDESAKKEAAKKDESGKKDAAPPAKAPDAKKGKD
jgi:hypothetical protein